jgi:low temperature requirement protein LtrA
MKISLTTIHKTLLLVAGALLILVGISILAAPVGFYASNEIELGGSVSLLNELKAPAGLLLAAGLFMLGAIFVRGQADTALGLAALVYLSYAGARGASMAFDGVPAAGLVQAAALEGIIGAACLAVLLVRRMPARRAA